MSALNVPCAEVNGKESAEAGRLELSHEVSLWGSMELLSPQRFKSRLGSSLPVVSLKSSLQSGQLESHLLKLLRGGEAEAALELEDSY